MTVPSLTAWLVLHAARAGAPVVTRDGPVVRAELVVAAPVDEVRALVRDPARAAAASSRKMTVTPQGTENGCTIASLFVETPMGDQGGTASICDTPTGSRVLMLQSKHFVHYEVVWTVDPDPAGARVVHRIEVQSRLPVPRSIVQSRLEKEVTEAMTRLTTWTP